VGTKTSEEHEKDLRQWADKVIDLWKTMDKALGENLSEEHLRLAIMAGLNDYEKQEQNNKKISSVSFDPVGLDGKLRCTKCGKPINQTIVSGG